MAGSACKVVFIGSVGDGKSTLGNAFLGDPTAFATGDGICSVTGATTARVGNWFFRQTDPLVAIDTPGLGEYDAEVEDAHVIDMVQNVKAIGGVNAFAIVVPFDRHRFGKPTLKMIQFFEATFGSGDAGRQDFWNHVVIVFTRCRRHDPRNPVTAEMLESKRNDWIAKIQAECRVQLRNVQLQFVDSLSLKEEPDEQADVDNRAAFDALRLHIQTLPEALISAVVVTGGAEHAAVAELRRQREAMESQLAGVTRLLADATQQRNAEASSHAAALKAQKDSLDAQLATVQRNLATVTQQRQAETAAHAATLAAQQNATAVVQQQLAEATRLRRADATSHAAALAAARAPAPTAGKFRECTGLERDEGDFFCLTPGAHGSRVWGTGPFTQVRC